MADTLVGTRLGAYELQRLLGSGGMAAVYQAFDHNLHRTVAVKVLAPEAALQPGFADRFQQEARLVARLHHPNIVQVYDFGQQDGITYMVQELLPGPTLARFMQEQRARGQVIGRDEVLDVVRQLAAGLDAAHAEGIIHRDVKPANALWNSAGTLVLTDFGIAKPTLESGKLTQVGMILGTPAYLSPEQAQGLTLSPASDVYALGVILYELVTGRVPFDGHTPMQVLWQHVHSPLPDLGVARPDLPPVVGDVLARALAKNPAERYGRAGDLALALANAWPAPAASAASIHEQATQAWFPPLSVPVQPAAPADGMTIAAAPATIPLTSPLTGAARPAAQPTARRNRPLLPMLGIVLALALVCGGALAVRGAAQSSDANAARVGATALPTGVSTPPGDDRLTGLATAAPAPAATDPFDTLRASLATGIAQGRTGDAGQELQADLDAAQAAIEAEQSEQAAAQLQAFLATLRANGTIDPAFASELSSQVEQLAASYQLTLLPAAPPAQTTGDNGDTGDKGKQGGKDNNDKQGGKGNNDKGGKGKKDD